MRTHGHNVGAVVADIGMLTMNWLAEHDIPYDEINFGKVSLVPFQAHY